MSLPLPLLFKFTNTPATANALSPTLTTTISLTLTLNPMCTQPALDLFTITNMPIKRFADFLHRRGELEEYMDLLVRNFNPAAVGAVMCRSTISVGWDGKVYDCDFNQQLGMGESPGAHRHPSATPVHRPYSIWHARAMAWPTGQPPPGWDKLHGRSVVRRRQDPPHTPHPTPTCALIHVASNRLNI